MLVCPRDLLARPLLVVHGRRCLLVCLLVDARLLLACFSLLQIPSSASYNNLDDDMRKSLVFCILNVVHGSVPALPAALALAALVRGWTCFIPSISHSRRPGPALASCAVNFGC